MAADKSLFAAVQPGDKRPMHKDMLTPATDRITPAQWLVIAAIWAAIGYGVMANRSQPIEQASAGRLTRCR
jgi:hypothetical protein